MSKLTPCMTATRLWAVLIAAPLRTVSMKILDDCTDPIRVEDLPFAWLARRREEDEADALGGALLVPLNGVHHGVGADGAVEGHRQLVSAEDPLHLAGQDRRVGQAQGGEQAQSDRLPVPVARVGARRLDR